MRQVIFSEEAPQMTNLFIKTLLPLTFGAFLFLLPPVSADICEAYQAAGVSQGFQAETPDLQWFRQELKIDPKYVDHREGIPGMGWAHFLFMVFLVIFFLGALIAYHRRTTRTARILERLLKEN
jgi:hypothetical protein